MKRYDVQIWITIEADNKRDAQEKAEFIMVKSGIEDYQIDGATESD